MRWIPVLLALSCAAPMLTAADRIVREKIEWLDVWLPDTNSHELPRVLLIGDSISKGYYKGTEEKLKGAAYVARLATSKSLGDPAFLEQVALVLREQTFDVVHFNNGLHGEGYTEAEYAAALPELIATFRKLAPKAKLIWATTTDIKDSPRMPRIRERNRLAEAIVNKEQIAIDDLMSVVKDHPDYHGTDGVHFNPTGNEALATKVAAAIRAAL